MGTIAATIWAARKSAAPGAAWTAGLIALVLSITSPMMTLYAAQPMLEMQGAFITVLTLLAAAGTGKKSKITTGILLLIALFTKYVYAQFLIVTLIISYFIDLIDSLRSGKNEKNEGVGFCDALFLFGPALIGAIMWFMRSEARAGYLAALQNPSTRKRKK